MEGRPDKSKIKTERMSRHLYDYQTLKHATLSFIPPDEILDIYRQDYEHMQEQMIYGDTLTFDDLIDQLKNIAGGIQKNQSDIT
ncbi:hypothetical protein FAM09_18160 [Niastella caeni]|uniref:Uncharacterized protein n=1 Tax=Niastella caeni TaxID=2569763 RepID=A0A4S8HNI8_9BACT|nr:hypothetical protein [Niastella caeni]THU36887.1 hypothetical protein FAM09_18160 [Niastella caeni]